MEEEAEKLMAENISKNFIDFEEYPMSVEIQVNRWMTRLLNVYILLWIVLYQSTDGRMESLFTMSKSATI